MTDSNARVPLRVADFDFELPEELIAQQPPAQRGASRMLVLDRATGKLADRHFTGFPSLLNPGDLLILNDSRVIPARLYAHRTTTRGKQDPTAQIEVLLTTPDTTPDTTPGAAANPSSQQWKALVKPGRKIQIGDQLEFPAISGEIILTAQVLARGEFGERTLRFAPVLDHSAAGFYEVLDQIGHMPLPPYIKRDDATADKARYQTVFALERGSVAAPTAGLHFTPEILSAIESRGVEIQKVTLHVGLGTFAPLRFENLSEIHLHSERYTLPAATAEAINRALAENRRIVAVGTTTVRTLEHCAHVAQQAEGNQVQPHSGETSIFLSPGHQFRLVNAMLTNFHLPKSSLLMLVSAFAGQEHGRQQVLSAYHHAVQKQYRFFSYGDCMFVH